MHLDSKLSILSPFSCHAILEGAWAALTLLILTLVLAAMICSPIGLCVPHQLLGPVPRIVPKTLKPVTGTPELFGTRFISEPILFNPVS